MKYEDLIHCKECGARYEHGPYILITHCPGSTSTDGHIFGETKEGQCPVCWSFPQQTKKKEE